MSHLNNNFPIVLFAVLTFIDNATCVYTSTFVPELQTYTGSTRAFSTWARCDLYKTGLFWSQFHVTQLWLRKRDFKRVGRISFTPAPPQNIWPLPHPHPPGQKFCNCSWSWPGLLARAVSSSLNTKSANRILQRRGKKKIQIKLRMCRIQTVSSEHTSLIIAFPNSKHVDGCSAQKEGLPSGQ